MNKMTYKGYTAQMEFDGVDKIIVGRVIDIDDIITFHGASVVEFEKAMQTAIDGYLSACEQLGRPKLNPARAITVA